MTNGENKNFNNFIHYVRISESSLITFNFSLLIGYIDLIIVDSRFSAFINNNNIFEIIMKLFGYRRLTQALTLTFTMNVNFTYWMETKSPSTLLEYSTFLSDSVLNSIPKNKHTRVDRVLWQKRNPSRAHSENQTIAHSRLHHARSLYSFVKCLWPLLCECITGHVYAWLCGWMCKLSRIARGTATGKATKY